MATSYTTIDDSHCIRCQRPYPGNGVGDADDWDAIVPDDWEAAPTSSFDKQGVYIGPYGARCPGCLTEEEEYEAADADVEFFTCKQCGRNLDAAPEAEHEDFALCLESAGVCNRCFTL